MDANTLKTRDFEQHGKAICLSLVLTLHLGKCPGWINFSQNGIWMYINAFDGIIAGHLRSGRWKPEGDSYFSQRTGLLANMLGCSFFTSMQSMYALCYHRTSVYIQYSQEACYQVGWLNIPDHHHGRWGKGEEGVLQHQNIRWQNVPFFSNAQHWLFEYLQATSGGSSTMNVELCGVIQI